MVDWWEYPTNFSGGQNVSGVGDFFMKYPSHILGNGMAMGIIVLIFCSLFGLTISQGSRKALLFASFVSFMLSIFWLKYLNPIIPIVLLVLTIIGAIGSKSEGNNY